MKKTLLFPLLIASSMFFGQQLISFESSEGFNLGAVNTQQSWQSNSQNQVISNEVAVDGTNSLKITKDPALPVSTQQQQVLLGGFYALNDSPSATDFTISFDVRATEQSQTSSEFVFATQSNPVVPGGQTALVYYISMSFNGSFRVADFNTQGQLALVSTDITWTPNTWYRIKVIGDANGISYYVNDTLAYTTPHLSNLPTQVNTVVFVHDNYSGSAYIDRLAINNEAALGTEEVVVNNTEVLVYPNPTSDFLHIKSNDKVNAVKVYDMTGKLLLTDSKDVVSVSQLQAGNYIVTVETVKGTHTEKFIKK